MVYTRILFNNIKEYTPNFLRTVPYSACVKPTLGYKKDVTYKMFKDPATIRLYARIKKHILDDGPNYHIFFFMCTFLVTSAIFYPMLYIYQSTNAHRQLDYVLAKEKAYKAKKAAEEEAENAEEEEAEVEEEPQAKDEKEEKNEAVEAAGAEENDDGKEGGDNSKEEAGDGDDE
jgi:hypothetical protein